jgi:hypothetical protein
MSVDSRISPRLTLRIGVTGHRPNRLDSAAQFFVAEVSRLVLNHLSGAASAVKAAHASVLASESPDLRLVTMLAEGADTILAHSAREANFRLDVILPFPRNDYVAAQGMQTDALAVFDSFLADAHSVLELDNRTGTGEADAYLSAGRHMLAHIDLLVAVWDGAPAAGVGGTAQIVGEAVRAGIPVVWIRPDGTVCIVTEMSHISSSDQGSEFTTGATPFDESIAAVVNSRLAPPEAGIMSRIRLERFQATPTPLGSTWCIYDFLRYLALGRKFRRRIDYRPDPDTEAAWARFRQRAEAVGGAEFARVVTEGLEVRWRHADALALHCSHAYRSTYVANFGLSAFAVAIGLLSVFWWSHSDSLLIKACFVMVEVGLIGNILWLTRQGGEGRSDWHARWLEARAVAEFLRSARIPALIGETASPPREPGNDNAPDAWVEWYVRATLREIGPPTCVLDAKSLRTAIDSAVEDEIDGQLAYSRGAIRSTHKLDHWLHIWGERLFLATFFVGIAYIVIALLATTGFVYLAGEWKDFTKAMTTFVGGAFPALGAALFGIRATGDFMVAGDQARRTLVELEALKDRLAALKSDPSQERVSLLLTMLTRVLATDIRDWAKIYRLRELILPG